MFLNFYFHFLYSTHLHILKNSHLSNLLCAIKFLQINSFNLLIQCFCNQSALYFLTKEKARKTPIYEIKHNKKRKKKNMKTIYHTRSYRTRNQCCTCRKFIKNKITLSFYCELFKHFKNVMNQRNL